MSNLTDDQVRHIAKLARLNISEEEVQRYTQELSSILNFVEQLQEVDTKDVEPSAQITGLRNGFREDQIDCDAETHEAAALLRPASRPSPEDLLACSPLPVVEHQIQTPSTHES